MSIDTFSPITFTPFYMERVWGGRELERVYGRSLSSPDRPYGESWELVDREDVQSVASSGIFVGTTLHSLWTEHRTEVFGTDYETMVGRFPILLKILDARDDLSIQVHPPVDLASSLGGEPKTEMWIIAARDPGAKLYVGFRRGVSRADFRQALLDGTVAECVHAIEPEPGQSIFIPSGRLHAIGAGFLIHEIQQNSDTTYRVFDWNRPGLDGKPRQLHVDKSMASIDFDDFEPSMDSPRGTILAECPYFRTDRHFVDAADAFTARDPDRFSILSMLSGCLKSWDGRSFYAGDTILLPRKSPALVASADTTIIEITLPAGGLDRSSMESKGFHE